MQNVSNTLFNIKHLDEYARYDNTVNNLNSLSKLIITVFYVVTLASFGRYEVISLLPFALIPVLAASLGEIPVSLIIRRILFFEPIIIIAAILNPILDRQLIHIDGFVVAAGWLTFISLVIKGTLMISAGIILIATTGIDGIASALRSLRIPSIFITVVVLIYRYFYVLMDEAANMIKAHNMRNPKRKGIELKVFSTMMGQLLLRTFARAQRIYYAMILRGYKGEGFVGKSARFGLKDIMLVFCTCSLIFIARIYNIPRLVEHLLYSLANMF